MEQVVLILASTNLTQRKYSQTPLSHVFIFLKVVCTMAILEASLTKLVYIELLPV
jgi:hypothetical protein